MREPELAPASVAGFSALRLSLELQEIAARLFDGADADEVTVDQRRVHHAWQALHGLHDAPKGTRDVRVLVLRCIEQAKDSDLDVADQVDWVIHNVGDANADLASKLDRELLQAVLMIWQPKRGRPKKGDAPREDVFTAAARLLGRATGVHVSGPSLRKLWERTRAAARRRI